MDRKRKQRAGQSESTEEREKRLAARRQRRENANRSESAEAREARLAAQRERQQRIRLNESTEAREARLAVRRERRQSTQRNESSEAREARLAAQRERRQSAQRNESSEAREARLAAQRERRRSAQRNESSEVREARLAAQRESQRRGRLNASAEATVLVQSNEFTDEGLAQRVLPRRQYPNSSRRAIPPLAGFHYNPQDNFQNHPTLTLGPMSLICRFCGAKKWAFEAPGLCCSEGKVRLPPLRDPPQVLKNLLLEESMRGVHFRNNIWRYNSCFAMTSFGVNSGSVCRTNSGRGEAAQIQAENTTSNYSWSTFKIKGQCYHLIGSLRPQPDNQPKFLQVFFMGGGEEETNQRCRQNSGVHHDIVAQLQTMLHETHPYIKEFKNALEMLDERRELTLTIRADRRPAGEHPRRFNAPTTNEVAAIVVVGEEYSRRDIVLHHQDNRLTHVSETHRSYDCLQYPLMFPYGEDGYNFELHQINPVTGGELAKCISSQKTYRYRLMVRVGDFNLLLRFKCVTNQFLVDMYIKIEVERLHYIRHNQDKLRAEQYIQLKDAILRDGNAANVGHQVILPSTFTGSPRYLHQRTQDAMSYVREFGRPDLFITFTCNPNWPEIKDNLFEHQKAVDRHDICARVFHGKLKKLLWLLKDQKIYGPLNAWMFTVEWQKRGLPHAHFLIWCKGKIKAADIDQIISAELPDPEIDAELFKIVSTHMIHGPCGSLDLNSPCIQENKCSKHYPRTFKQETCTGNDGYPIYRRRSPTSGGFTATIKRRNRSFQVDNSWVVPYSPFLVKTFNAHINVESCSSVKSIKYICKYINKGEDMAVIGINEDDLSHDEVTQYLMGRYISSNMAAWRIFGFEIHESYPPVIKLDVHLESGQRVYFTEATASHVNNHPPETTLTGFFKLCAIDRFAATLFYADIPKYFTWYNNKWQRRRRGVQEETAHGETVFRSDVIGRVYTVHPKDQECLFLRLLLHHMPGPTSFSDLRLFNGTVCSSYREACLKHGLLEDDSHWNVTLTEAAECRSPREMRRLFCVMLAFCGLNEPLQLWEVHKDSMSEDFLRRLQAEDPSADFNFNDAIYNEALLDLQKQLQSMGCESLSSFELAQPQNIPNALAAEYMRELNYNVEDMEARIFEDEPRLLSDQRYAYNQVLASTRSEKGKLFFLHAPGGTGKTLLLNLLLANLRKDRKIALAVASSGIAATLLHGGRTAHSSFKLPLDLAKRANPTCNINRGSVKGNLMTECSLIVWDEATMSHKAAFEALDRSLQDLRRNNSVMGGVTVLLAGDFRQTLPVIPGGTRVDEINASIKFSYLWNHVEKLQLSTNMRALTSGNPDVATFSLQLLQIGNGMQLADGEGSNVLPFGTYVADVDELLDCVFPEIDTHFVDNVWLRGRAILAPHNSSADVVNHKLLEKIPGELKTFKSIDTNATEEDVVKYPVEFLNSQTPAGLPPHKLHLKIGVPVMLLRNLEPPTMCNGTRMVIKAIMSQLLELTILNGPAAGTTIFIPPMRLTPSGIPFRFSRLQFPVKLCFAITINKAQGQSLEVVGLNLTEQVFSHGQLYVGCSRVGNSQNLFILEPKNNIKNVVYPEALQ